MMKSRKEQECDELLEAEQLELEEEPDCEHPTEDAFVDEMTNTNIMFRASGLSHL